MAKSTRKWVAFKSNATIPADMAGTETDLKVQVGEPQLLPAFYAQSVVNDRIASYCAAPANGQGRKPGKRAAPGAEGDADGAAQLAAAQAALDTAQAAAVAAQGSPGDAAAQAEAQNALQG